jgi:hypothetical protein
MNASGFGPRFSGGTPIFGSTSVRNTPEVTRISLEIRRVWPIPASESIAKDLTRELKTPNGGQELRPVQAIALYETMEMGGLFAPIRVGGGKSLISMLLPVVLEAKRPILLIPAGLLEKTRYDYSVLREHWRLPTNLQFLSYELLGLVQSEDKLNYISPDLIIADECHKIKSIRAGRTKRVRRYMHDNPSTKFCAMSGTIMKSSINDFAPLLRWALKEHAPIPRTVEETNEWAEALDHHVNPISRRKPGAIFDLAPRVPAAGQAGPAPALPAPIWPLPGGDPITAARQVFQSRLLETRGVVASPRTDGVTCSLVIRPMFYDVAQVTVDHIQLLRKTWVTPDGWPFKEALEFARYIRSLSIGFHSIWSPRPPPEWTAARKAWGQFARETLAHSHTVDTELHLANKIDAREIDDCGVLRAWRAVRDSYKPNPKPVWHDDSALRACAEWMEREKGIVWTKHVFFAHRLAQMTGADYYGADAVNQRGESIVYVKAGKAIIASADACGAGQNLQMFSSNLMTSWPSGALQCEQLLGRTHRDGQEADEVYVDVMIGCMEHHDAYHRAVDGARTAADLLGHDQKLLLATSTIPDTLFGRRGPLWGEVI